MIREAQATDEDSIVLLWQECGLVVSYNDPRADLRLSRGSPTSTVFVSSEPKGGSVDGCVMVGHDGHRGWLYYLAVADHMRHKGLGRELVAAAEDWLRHHEVPKCQLLIREHNLSVIDFYRKIGFEVIPRTIMAKQL